MRVLLEQHVVGLNEEVEQIAPSDPARQQLRQIPSIGPLVATAIVAAIGNGAAFYSVRSEVASGRSLHQMNGFQHYLWRAVDQNGTSSMCWCSRVGTVVQLCVSFASYSLRQRAPHVIITDKLWSYAAAKKLILPDVERQSRSPNNNRTETRIS
jgi:DDE superfamily endonuclease